MTIDQVATVRIRLGHIVVGTVVTDRATWVSDGIRDTYRGVVETVGANVSVRFTARIGAPSWFVETMPFEAACRRLEALAE